MDIVNHWIWLQESHIIKIWLNKLVGLKFVHKMLIENSQHLFDLIRIRIMDVCTVVPNYVYISSTTPLLQAIQTLRPILYEQTLFLYLEKGESIR